MDKSRWQKIETILDKAMRFSNQQKQEEFVIKACEPDQKLYNQVSTLLSSIREAKETNFLEEH